MPELPEVETTRRGIAASVEGKTLTDWTIRNAALRWPVRLPTSIRGQRVRSLRRRAKYLIFELSDSALILHLGMSGSLRVVAPDEAILTHDHVDLVFDSTRVLRLNDPRRFGSLHCETGPVDEHWLLRHLGVEPLSEVFTGNYLKQHTRGRRQAIKNLIMDGHIVVGVGNIYANEALFLAGIRPTMRAQRMTLAACEELVRHIKQVLANAIEVGGTTLRDYVGGDGKPGYFQQQLYVYGREGKPCRICETVLKGVRLGQRASVYCPKCQSAQGFRP